MAFFTARQPILDIEKDVFAYELLFRDSLKNVFPDVPPNEATLKMVEGLQLNLGLDTLTQNKLAFINFTEETLLERFPLMLPREQVVVEVLETVTPNKKLLAVVKELKQEGYTVALDDYEHAPVWKHFYPYTDIIKIDWKLTSIDEIRQVIQDISDFPHIKLLAEKVETHEEFEIAKELGFCYFQGYFFSKPEVLQSRALTSSQMALAELMAEMAKEDPNIDLIVQAFEVDVNLSFKLLRYSQSPIFKRRSEITNIKQAIVALGQQELRRFVSLLFTTHISAGKPAELTTMSLVRARFCESLSKLPDQTHEPASAFLVGLLSLLDAMLDTELSDLLNKLPLANSIKQPLCEGEGLLASYLSLCHAFEAANWANAGLIANQIEVDFDQSAHIYLESVKWAIERMSIND
ncbi:EAL and HDOD domain-containing protein [Alteromonas sp. a30]|uniref:EAL and HDOD domain-containing protein n=1 Tax=Alteromonas sp. a30 TaxID=2730917 RepID=UPI00227DC19E|nr:EAL domain-containing protein [Alteromonas sp. a30]MCY7295877.1 EAL domain-containing protein [Alteromonas sp. a30]